MEGDHIEHIFKDDRNKQQRYLNFCYEKEGKVVGGIAPATVNIKNSYKKSTKIYISICF